MELAMETETRRQNIVHKALFIGIIAIIILVALVCGILWTPSNPDVSTDLTSFNTNKNLSESNTDLTEPSIYKNLSGNIQYFRSVTHNETEPRPFMNNGIFVFRVGDGNPQIILSVIEEINTVPEYHLKIVIRIEKIDAVWNIKGTTETLINCKQCESSWVTKTINTVLHAGDILCVMLTVLEDNVQAHFSIGKESFMLKLPGSVTLTNRLYSRIGGGDNTDPYQVSWDYPFNCWE
ncbi:unnamed protein product [Meganyctiphanes norvegica]|uniref:Galectin n=1 Tax=Meganyctiphanes norvegica TaxID=48144 RepID=A0AAV2SQP7_MEGNR